MNLSLFNKISNILQEGRRLPVKYQALKLRGSDVFRYLQGQITNDLSLVSPTNFISSCLLDGSGKIVAHFYILKSSQNEYLIFSLPSFVDVIINRLDQYIISDDVEIESLSEEYEALIGFNFDQVDALASGKILNLPGFFANTASISNYSILDEQSFKKIIFYSGESLQLAQTEAELLNNTVYMELSTSINKGCFLGQETVAKIQSRRGAGKKWTCIETEGLQLEASYSNFIVNEKETEVLDAIEDDNNTYFKVFLKRDLRVEGKSIDLVIGEKNTRGKVRYFPIDIWNLSEWTEQSYLKAVEVFHQGNDSEAINILESLIKVNPQFEDAYESLGVILGRQEKYQEAINYFKKLETINPNSVLVHTNLSLNYMKLGKIELAEEYKAQATIKTFEHFGKEADKKREAESTKKDQERQNQERESMFKEVLEIDPDDALANYGLGEIRASAGNYIDAEKYLSKALESDSKYSLAYLKLAEVMIALNSPNKAQSLLERGIQVAASLGNHAPANQMQALLDDIQL